jgi:acylphosphatase
MQRLEVFFSGRVQGVGFRYMTVRAARALGLHGYVRNLADGRVHAVAEGPPDALDNLMDSLRREFVGYISDVSETRAAATGEFRGFEVRI